MGSNKPFKFSESEKEVNSLLKTLEKIGLLLKDKQESYNREIWEMNCLWKKDDDIKIIWERKNWPDGEHEEDKMVSITVNSKVIGAVDVGILLTEKINRNLRGYISKEIELITSGYTGKNT